MNMKTIKAEERIESLEKEERTLLSNLSTLEVNTIRQEVAIAMADI